MPYRKDERDLNFSKHIYFPETVLRFDVEGASTYVVRDIANRGPLLFNGSKMRSLGFFDER